MKNKNLLAKVKKLRTQLTAYFQKYHLQTAVFGKSQGIDSSLMAALLAGVKNVKPIGVIMPCYSLPDDERIAKLVLDYYLIPCLKINLNSIFDLIKSELSLGKNLSKQLQNLDIPYFKNNEKLALGNIKARIRMITLYHLAKLTQGCVIGTGNLSEYMTGFWTLHGDVGDIYPLIQLTKTEVYAMAKFLQVPTESLQAVPTDGLDIAGTDEEQLGISYSQLDQNIAKYLNKEKNINPIVLKRIKNTEFKRKLPIFLDK